MCNQRFDFITSIVWPEQQLTLAVSKFIWMTLKLFWTACFASETNSSTWVESFIRPHEVSKGLVLMMILEAKLWLAVPFIFLSPKFGTFEFNSFELFEPLLFELGFDTAILGSHLSSPPRPIRLSFPSAKSPASSTSSIFKSSWPRPLFYWLNI